MTKYRIITDDYSGYEVQRKLWFWPFWHQPHVNTHHSLEAAKSYLKKLKRMVVYEENNNIPV